MKIKFIEIEADATELKSNRSLSEILCDALEAATASMRANDQIEKENDQIEGDECCEVEE